VIGVKGYTMVKRQEVVKTCYVWVGGETAQIAVGTTRNITEDTAETIDLGKVKEDPDGDGAKRTVAHYEIKSAYEFGGGKISFTKEEIAAFRNFGPPVIRIIGFKPLSLLPEWANCRTATFLYPDEANYVGSTRVFSALQQTLLKTQKFAFSWFQVRVNAVPTLVALIPGAEKVDSKTEEQTMPPGLWAIQLPFADDIRPKPPSGNTAETVPAPKKLVDLMTKIINQMRLPNMSYNPSKYPNPSLQWFYRILQALALEEEVPTTPEDKTLPRFRQIHMVSCFDPSYVIQSNSLFKQRAGEHIKKWNEELKGSMVEFEEEHKSKRPLPHSIENDIVHRAAKKIKTDNDIADGAMRAYYDSGTLSKVYLANPDCLDTFS
jgi:ATP-dependent DNA helicase 2 subunit 1